MDKAIKNEHFVTWPRINTTDVAKHLTPTIATTKGHLDRKRKNIKSTQKKLEKKTCHDAKSRIEE